MKLARVLELDAEDLMVRSIRLEIKRETEKINKK